MKTLLTHDPEEAAALLREGNLVAFPTETVYGLGADAFNSAAVRNIFEAKQRPSDNPLIVHISHFDQLPVMIPLIPDDAMTLMEAFFPGPMTLVMRHGGGIPDIVTGGRPSLGIRMPDHPLAQAFLRACRCPVAAPSANRSGRPSPTTWEAVHTDLDGRISGILMGEPTVVGLESTVVDVTGPTPVILRLGGVSLEAIHDLIPTTRLATPDDDVAKSPGTKYRHYAPRATVHITDEPPVVEPGLDTAFIGLTDSGDFQNFDLTSLQPTVEAYANALYSFFRHCDLLEIRDIYCERVPDVGLGRALNDRLERASCR